MSKVHDWFELTYAQYLTVPRSILQAMPAAWQARFVACLEELDHTFAWRPKEGRYWVTLKDAKGRIVADRFREYRHPDLEAIEAACTGSVQNCAVDELEWLREHELSVRATFEGDGDYVFTWWQCFDERTGKALTHPYGSPREAIQHAMASEAKR
jgi:hypothetical protein